MEEKNILSEMYSNKKRPWTNNQVLILYGGNIGR